MLNVVNVFEHSWYDLLSDFPRERVPVVLSPLIYREQEDITEDRSLIVVYIPHSIHVCFVYTYVRIHTSTTGIFVA